MRSSLSSTQVANRFAYSKRNVSILTNLSRNSCSLQTAKSQNTSPHDIARDIPCIASTTCRIGNVSFNFLFFSKRSVTILKFQRKFRQKMSARFSKKSRAKQRNLLLKLPPFAQWRKQSTQQKISAILGWGLNTTPISLPPFAATRILSCIEFSKTCSREISKNLKASLENLKTSRQIRPTRKLPPLKPNELLLNTSRSNIWQRRWGKHLSAQFQESP